MWFGVHTVLLALFSFACSEICQDEVCEYSLDVKFYRTMLFKKDKYYDIHFNETCSSHLYAPKYQNGACVPDDEVDKTITGDGQVRNIVVINDQFPGPTIEVMEGSKVKLHDY